MELQSCVELHSTSSIPRISLSLDSSACASTSQVLLDIPEEKRKVLEHRLINNPHARNTESVVGFGENSKDKIYSQSSNPAFEGLYNGSAKLNSANESNFQRHDLPSIQNDRSRDRAYIPGAPVLQEHNKDAHCSTPITPIKVTDNVCKEAQDAKSIPRDTFSDIERKNAEAHNGDANESILVCSESMDHSSAIKIAESGHFSTEELDSSEEEYEGSGSSNQGGRSTTLDRFDGVHSIERKRKLFGNDDVHAANGLSKAEGRISLTTDRPPKRSSKHQSRKFKFQGESQISDGVRAEKSPPKNPRTITHFFPPTSSTSNVQIDNSGIEHPPPASEMYSAVASAADKCRELSAKELELDRRERQLIDREREVAAREANQSKFEEDALARAANVAREERMQSEGLRRQHDERVFDLMKSLLIARAREERVVINSRLCSDTARVGRVGYIRSGLSVSEVWEDGSAWSELSRRFEELEAEDSRLERDRKAFSKRCKSSTQTSNPNSSGMQPPAVPSDEQAEQEEIFRLRAQKLRDKKKLLQEEKEKLEREKFSLIRELKRVQDQNRSKYNDFPLLNKRYLLLQLLGKGGFSEVYRAFDMVEMQEVACKIHELNTQWSEEKKANYMKHATREYEIQKKLCHQRIVRLIDVFEVSSDGFCTVLEFCNGGDLEQALKSHKTLPEREARSIIMQVFAGLRYLNEQKLKVIHYDLKPANILFHNGEVKISDFGLSKVMDDPKDGMVELTSQGAGTYWYLPPECFEIGHAPPKISSKVDVWSAGVIFFQMLYGVKPFGHGMSQEKMLMEQTITKSTSVVFPEGKDVPRVSDKAKDLIRRCLSYHQMHRPDVLSVFQDPYLRHSGRQASAS